MITAEDVFAERTRRKLSRTRFAELVGLTPTKVNNIEHKRRPIRPEELDLLRPFVPELGVTSVDGSGDIFLLDEDEELMLLEPLDPTTSDQPVRRSSVATASVPPVIGAVAPPFVTPTGPPPAPLVSPVTAPVGVTPATTITPRVGVTALHTETGLRQLSNSEVQTFKHCRRRWWLGWYRGLRLRLRPVTGALPLGSRVHLALAGYYVPEGQPATDPREALEQVLTRDEADLVQSLAQYEAADAAQVLIDFKRDADLARAMIEGYVQWLAETGADQGYIVDAPEQVLVIQLPLPGDARDVLLKGRLDLRLRREHDGVRLFLDHKTTGNLDRLIRLLIWDEQLKHYHVLEEGSRLPEEPRVEGALYNMLRKVKRTETATPPFYQRVEVHHNVHEVARFRERLVGEALAIQRVEWALGRGEDHQRVVYPTPSERCLWGCEFKAVCPMFDDNSRAEDFITQHYETVNPLDRYDDDEIAVDA